MMIDVTTVLISCILAISLLVFKYEKQIDKLVKANKKMFDENLNLLNYIENLMKSHKELAFSHDTLYEILKEKFTDEEIEMYKEKFDAILVKCIREDANKEQ